MEMDLEKQGSDWLNTSNSQVLFNKQGYIIERGFFDSFQIDHLRESAKDIFEIQFKHFGYRKGRQFKLNAIQLFKEHPEVFMNCGKLIQTGLIDLYDLATHPALINTVAYYGVEKPLMCTRPVLFFNHPDLAKSEEYYKSPLHQDWPSMQASMNSLVVWVPLVDVDEDNGSIIIYPGSHKKGVLPFSTKGGFANVEYEGESIQPELKMGDICIFSTLLVHKSGEIKNDTIRWSCHFRYTDMLDEEFVNRGFPNPYQYLPITKKL